MWSLKPAWGEFVQGKNSACIKILDGKIELESVTLGNMGKVTSVIADGNNIPFMQNGNTVKFDTVTVTKEIKFI